MGGARNVAQKKSKGKAPGEKGTHKLRKSNWTSSSLVVMECISNTRDLKLGREENRAKHWLIKFHSFASNRLGQRQTSIALRDRK